MMEFALFLALVLTFLLSLLSYAYGYRQGSIREMRRYIDDVKRANDKLKGERR